MAKRCSGKKIAAFRRGKGKFSAKTGQRLKKNSCTRIVKVPSKFRK